MSRNRTNPNAGYIDPKKLPRGHNGRPLCRYCNQEVPRGRRTFCGDLCVHEWKLRSNPGYMRDHVFRRDRGICLLCGTNCDELEREMKRIKRVEGYHAHQRFCQELQERGFSGAGYRSLWQADHIIPVAEGGGECALANLRTLCTPCHNRVTRDLHKRLTAARRGAVQLSLIDPN